MVVAGFGCGASGTPAPDGSVTGAGGKDANADAGSDGAPSGSGCVPQIPAIAWTSPYAGWTRGVPRDPSFFPISVWLQGSWHATEMAHLGVNVYVGNNAGTDPLAASDLAILKSLGIYAIVGQDSVGLANIDDPTIVGWWMTPDEPDNAQSERLGRLWTAGRAVDPGLPVQRVQGRRPDAAGLPRPRAGRRLRRLGGAGEQRAARVAVRPRRRRHRVRHLPLQQLRRRREREGDVWPVLAERLRRRSPAPVVDPRPGGLDGHRDDDHQRGDDGGPHARADEIGGVARVDPRRERNHLLSRHVGPDLPRGRHLRQRRPWSRR